MNLKDLASLGVRRAVLSAAFVGKTPGEGPPKGGGDPVYLPTKATPGVFYLLDLSPPLTWRLTHKGHTGGRSLGISPPYPSVVSRPLAPLTWRLTGLPLRLFIQGESEGDELALRSLGIFDDPELAFPLLVLFRE